MCARAQIVPRRPLSCHSTVTSAPSAVSEAKHPKPLREAIDACRVSLLKQARCLMGSVRKKAAGQQHPAVATATAQDDYDLSWQEGWRRSTVHPSGAFIDIMALGAKLKSEEVGGPLQYM